MTSLESIFFDFEKLHMSAFPSESTYSTHGKFSRFVVQCIYIDSALGLLPTRIV
jgi:hypothetical protein